MTVKELIEELNKYDLNNDVYIGSGYNYYTPTSFEEFKDHEDVVKVLIKYKNFDK